MTYITIINNEVLSCSSDKHIIESQDIEYLNNAKAVSTEMLELLSQKQAEINSSVERGYADGYQEGLENGRIALDSVFKKHLLSITEKFLNDEVYAQKMAIEIAYELINKIAEDIPRDELMSSIIKTALNKIKGHPYYEIIVNEANALVIDKQIKELALARKISPTSIRILVDKSLGDLDCHIKTDAGVTVANFNEQIDILKSHLTKNLGMISDKSQVK
jgi:flagellar biosynthesis/type III secretory pathway protein FliH